MAKSATTFEHAVVVSAAEDFAGDLLDLAIDEFLIEGPTVFLVTG